MALNAGFASIPALVARHAAQHGNATILRKKTRGIWQAVSWRELADRMRQVAQALQADGFARGDVGGVLAETRPEWVAADLGILAAGGVSAGLPTDGAPDRLGAVLRATGCRLLFVENEEQLDKVLEVRAACPVLRRIVIFDMKGLRDFADPDCVSFADFLAHGAQADAGQWDATIAGIAAHDPAVLLVPADAAADAVQSLTHGELLQEVADAQALLQPHAGDQRVALLPMADRLERIWGLYCALAAGTISNYLESPDTALENLQEVQPTLLGSDAALWRLLHERISRAAMAATPVQRVLYRVAIAAGTRGGIGRGLARALVLHHVRHELGLARLRLAYVGGPSPSPEISAWAMGLGIRLRRATADARQPPAAEQAFGALAAEA